jgi:hypothetical protein
VSPQEFFGYLSAHPATSDLAVQIAQAYRARVEIEHGTQAPEC